MDYQSALARLWNHANMPAREVADTATEDSFVYKLFKCHADNTEFDIAPYVNDIINCLESVNTGVNGETPSETPIPRPPVDRGLALAISTIINDGWQYHLLWESGDRLRMGFREQLARALWTISCAWVLVLHGDIDSIREYIGYERAALGLGDLGAEDADRTGEANPNRR